MVYLRVRADKGGENVQVASYIMLQHPWMALVVEALSVAGPFICVLNAFGETLLLYTGCSGLFYTIFQHSYPEFRQ